MTSSLVPRLSRTQMTVIKHRLVAIGSEDLQGIYAKSWGYVARLAMVMFVLEQATNEVSTTLAPECLQWSIDILPFTVEAAEAIVHHLNSQKEILMGVNSASKSNLITPISIARLIMKTNCL